MNIEKLDKKLCIKCNITKSIEEFRNPEYMSVNICKSCTSIYKKEHYRNNKDKIKKYHQTYNKNNKELIKHKRTIYYNNNKESFQKRTKKYREQNKSHIKNRHLMYKYNITMNEKLDILYYQNNKCKLCEIQLDIHNNQNFVHLDHDHSTNKIRGILCGNCNASIGFSRENIEYIKNAITYLEKNNKFENIRNEIIKFSTVNIIEDSKVKICRYCFQIMPEMKNTICNKCINLMKRYNINGSHYNYILNIQERKCAICMDYSERLFVDHDHNNNNIRGLLCNYCNSFIGFAKDNIQILNNMIEYLKNNRGES